MWNHFLHQLKDLLLTFIVGHVKNHSKKPTRNIFSVIEFWISRVIFPRVRVRGKIAREIQISMALNIFLAGFFDSLSKRYFRSCSMDILCKSSVYLELELRNTSASSETCLSRNSSLQHTIKFKPKFKPIY